MMMMLVGHLDDGPCFGGVCVQFLWVARVAEYALAAIVFHDSRRKCLCQFFAGFSLINWPSNPLLY
jgi:hypothetical protein